MRKLTKEERVRLQDLVKKLDNLDPNSKDAKKIKEELEKVTNEFASISNKTVIEDEPTKNIPVKKKVKAKEKRQTEVKEKVVDEVLAKENSRKTKIKELDEEELLNNEMFMDLLKAVLELNQQCVDYCLILLENAKDNNVKSIKKCIENNTENKRQLKKILKEYVDFL